MCVRCVRCVYGIKMAAFLRGGQGTHALLSRRKKAVRCSAANAFSAFTRTTGDEMGASAVSNEEGLC